MSRWRDPPGLHNMCMNMNWRDLLPELLTAGEHRTQADLVAALAAEGHEVNQASVSRELATLGVRKVGGVYRLPPSPHAGAPIHAFSTTSGGCLAIVRTEPAFAMVVAQAIDAASLAGVLGTVAGDDTLFVATEGARASARVAEFLGVRARPSRARCGSPRGAS